MALQALAGGGPPVPVAPVRVESTPGPAAADATTAGLVTTPMTPEPGVPADAGPGSADDGIEAPTDDASVTP
jgi:hypothetical protein